MSAVVTTVIAAVSAFAAVASALLYLYFGRRSNRASAREEALALAETRRQLQLAIYSRVVREIWGRRPKSVWLLLRNGEEQSPAHGAVTGVLHENVLRLKALE
jgi:hypothetical protein